MPLGRQVEGNPEAERLPRRFGEEARKRDRPEAPRREEFRHRGLRGASVRVGLPRQDLLALAGRKQCVLARRAVEGVPERRPEKADCAGDDEGRAPPERQRDRGDERRRDQGSERGADVEEADRDRLLLVRKPFRDRLHAGGNRRRFRQPHQAARARQRNPACDAPLQAAGDRPQRRKQGEAEPEADEIDDQPADRLHDRVADLERADDVGILLRADAHLVLQRGREHAERVARKVVDDGAEGDQRDDPPSQASNFRHGSSLRLRHVLAASFWPMHFGWRSRRGLDCRR